MASPVYVASGTAQIVSTTSVGPGWPAGIANGDVAFLQFTVRDGTSTVPSGWNTVLSVSYPSAETWIAWRVYDSGAAPTITATGTGTKIAIIHAYRGANTNAPVHVVGTNDLDSTDDATANQTLTYTNTITTTLAECTVVYWASRRTQTSAFATMSAHSSITWAERNESTGGDLSSLWGDGARATAGTVGGTTIATTTPNSRPTVNGYLALGPGPLRTAVDLTDVGSSAWVAPASGTEISPTYPGSLAEGDVVYMILHTKGTASTDTTIPSTPADWASVGTGPGGGTVTPAAGVGPTRMTVFKRLVPSGGLTGSQAVTITGGNSVVGYMRAFRASGTNLAFEEAVTTWGRSAAGTTIDTSDATAPAIGTLDLAAKDMVIATIGTADDQSATLVVTGITQTGTTFGSITADPAGTVVNSQGFDLSAASFEIPVTAGAGAAAPVVTATSSTSETSLGLLLRVRATAEVAAFLPATPKVHGYAAQVRAHYW